MPANGGPEQSPTPSIDHAVERSSTPANGAASFDKDLDIADKDMSSISQAQGGKEQDAEQDQSMDLEESTMQSLQAGHDQNSLPIRLEIDANNNADAGSAPSEDGPTLPDAPHQSGSRSDDTVVNELVSADESQSLGIPNQSNSTNSSDEPIDCGAQETNSNAMAIDISDARAGSEPSNETEKLQDSTANVEQGSSNREGTPDLEELAEMLAQQSESRDPNTQVTAKEKIQVLGTVFNRLGVDFPSNLNNLHDDSETLMDDDLEDDSDLEIDRQFAEADRQIQAKRRRGQATEEEELEFLRLKRRRDNAHKSAQMQRQCQRQGELSSEGYSDEDDIFVAEDKAQPESGSEFEDNSRAASRKKRKLNPKGANGPKANPKSAPRTKAAAKMTGKKTARSKKKTKRQVAEERQQNNLTNLAAGGLHTNIFHDAQGNNARADQPSFKAKRRQEALREMLASIPAEIQEIAKIDLRQLKEALKHFTPNGSCRSNGDSGWHVTGMESSLSHYQMLGVSWMRQRETQGDEDGSVPGGLIADAMGLGKTVMCIANIVNGKPKSKYLGPDECNTTLIVVPGSLVSQWLGELSKHARSVKLRKEAGLKDIGLHNAKNKIGPPDDLGLTMKAMKRYDVIVTTYSELCRQYPKYNPPTELRTAVEKQEWWTALCEKKFGPLHRLRFHRVILDEATAIKNHLSQTSMACRAIQARFRWVVTGTPAQNRSSEFFPYFKFLRFPNTGSFKIFKQNFCNADEHGNERLHHVLSGFMLRRSHGDELLGSKLLNLPTPTQKTVNVYLTDIEQEIYKVVHRRFVARINGISQAGQIKKNYSHIFVLLTRLRQLVCHPLLIHDTIRDLLEPEDFEALRKITDRPCEQFKEQSFLLAHLRKMLSKPRDLAVLESDVSLKREGGAFAQRDDTRSFLEALELEKPVEEAPLECPHCQNSPRQPVFMKCGHVYCMDCVLKASYAQNCVRGRCAIDGLEFEFTEAPKKSKKRLSTDDDGEDDEESGGRNKKQSAKGVIETWVDAKGHMVPSSKTTTVKAQILEWKAQHPEAKIIIYTQFLSMVRILAKMCAMEGWNAVQLHGGIKMSQRDKNIKEFAEDETISILISTIQSGGLGLNLTMASRVLLLDLWWNTAVEQQAFCRTYRRGQTAETAMTRLAAHNTIDDQILLLQEHKEEEIQAIMTGNGYQKLTAKQLMGLFGAVETDEEGCNFIVINDGPQGKQQRPHGADKDDAEGDDQ